jgi:hypothetical protein
MSGKQVVLTLDKPGIDRAGLRIRVWGYGTFLYSPQKEGQDGRQIIEYLVSSLNELRKY